ncbi:MAG TPA: hypothetical protein VFA79_14325 [Myxococcales bacterium]|nr:hypothetical protein [Myxococcales bacterium]
MAPGILLGAIAGAAIATLPGSAGIVSAILGALLGGAIGARSAERRMGFSIWSLALIVFFVPLFTLAVPPGADMAMHVALARGLLDGNLSPAWPGVEAGAYPRGFSAVVALLSPAGLARAGLAAAAVSYLVFWAGLTAFLQGPLRTPAARTVAAIAVLLSRTPQTFFDWGGNPTVLALGLALFGAAQENWRASALYLAGAAATHPMGACAGALALALRWRRPAVVAGGAGALCLTLAALALWGPHLSARETAWIRDYAVRQEGVSLAVLGDPANIATALAAAVLLWKRQFRPVAFAAAAILGLFGLFALLPSAGLYPARFAPLLLLAVTPLWGRAAATRIPLVAPVALLLAMPGHFRWYQGAAPMATRADLEAIACLDRQTPPRAVVDGAYGDATQWIPALAGRAVTRPHQHVSLFDETDAALARLPRPAFRFTGERLRYGDAAPRVQGTPMCGGAVLRLQ